LYKSGTYTFTQNQDPADTVKDIVDFVNAEYDYFSYDTESIKDFGQSVSIDFENDNCLQAVQKVVEATDFTFFIDRDGKVHFRGKEDFDLKNLTIGLNVEQISLTEENEDRVNALLLEYAGGTKEYDESGTEKLRQVYLKRDITDETSADIFANSFFEDKNKTNKETVVILRGYQEEIQAGDRITVKNFGFDLSDLQIKKLSYKEEEITLYLEKFNSFSNLIL